MTPVWTPRALDDLGEIIAHIAADNPVAASELAERAIAVVGETLAGQPHIGRPGRVDGTREFVVRPSYILVYRVQKGRVEVLAFRHAARLWPGAF